METKKRRVTIRIYPSVKRKFKLVCVSEDVFLNEKILELMEKDIRQGDCPGDLSVKQKWENMTEHLNFDVPLGLYSEFKHACQNKAIKPERRINQLIRHFLDERRPPE